MSYQNAIMYSRVIPTTNDKSDRKNKPAFDESLDACDSANYEDFDQEETIRTTDL